MTWFDGPDIPDQQQPDLTPYQQLVQGMDPQNLYYRYYNSTWQAIQVLAHNKQHDISEEEAQKYAVDLFNAAPHLVEPFVRQPINSQGNPNLDLAAIKGYLIGNKETKGLMYDEAEIEAMQKDLASEAKAAAAQAKAEAVAARQEARDQAAEVRAQKLEFRQEHAGTISLMDKYFGKTIYDDNMILSVASKGNIAQQEDYVRSMDSHLTVNNRKVSIGQYYDTRQIADKASMDAYGMASNDTIVTDLLTKGLTNATEAKYYYTQLPFQPGKGHDIDPNYYNAVYKAVAPIHKAIWNDEPHPQMLADVAQQHGGFQPQEQASAPAQ